ncbi:MAG: transketolase [Candidatus Lambdaproteobacteria bacterium RIFOXYD2_FULL_50_16]|uniref:Transketolase n=1 Tax=Candidatus Lambdaproteobacteria bacterium RIFOXYD2_FULL_50_16 TaxID=1817772 RepID=A0A1F6G9M5_9PROT|nr:MAG: transketolase [Candidatus Lambdaproteobacteria bacterium RIFOXYD2_FULL_50_16]
MANQLSPQKLEQLKAKAQWVWNQTLLLHKRAPETRVASSLSDVETFVCLYYGDLLQYDPKNPRWEGRDRFVISKGHGSISMYPILADCGFFPLEELERICTAGSFLGGIPDPIIPGYETINGSLGHGLGVASGMALGQKNKGDDRDVLVLVGDGELSEGSNWEAIMFAAHHGLDNLTLIIDDNGIGMLDLSVNILNWTPIKAKLDTFGWEVFEVDGHDIEQLHPTLAQAKSQRKGKPKVVIAKTIKGRGTSIENHPLSHILMVKADEVDRLVDQDGALQWG